MQLEYSVFDLTKKASIILNEHQLGSLDVAFQEINFRLVAHERIQINEADCDPMPRRYVDGGAFHMECAFPDDPTASLESN
jgi:hypothetical protein